MSDLHDAVGRRNAESTRSEAATFPAGRIQLSATVMDDGEDSIVGQIIRNTLLANA